MKFKLFDLLRAAEKLQREMYGWGEPEKERNYEVDITIAEENPGNGAFVDSLLMSVVKPEEATTFSPKHDVSIKVEVFSAENKQKPRITKLFTEEILDK